MKSKKIVKIIMCIFVVLILLLFILFFFFVNRGFGITIGRCLIADNGSYLMVDKNSPIVMSTDSGSMFQNLSTGDKILVFHSGVNESYPGSTGAYFCLKLGDGDIYDIPTNVIRELTNLGWIGNTEETTPYHYETVSYITDTVRMSIALLDGWEYQIIEPTEDTDYCGIQFWPKGYSDGKLSLFYYENFAVKCGTGLEQKLISIESYNARQGTYDNHAYWSFIAFLEPWEDYVLLNDGNESWINDYEEDIQFMMESILFDGRVEDI